MVICRVVTAWLGLVNGCRNRASEQELALGTADFLGQKTVDFMSVVESEKVPATSSATTDVVVQRRRREMGCCYRHVYTPVHGTW